VQSPRLHELIDFNNQRAAQDSKWQYLFLLGGKHPPLGTEEKMRKLLENPKLSDIQRQNVQLNLELIEFETTRLDLFPPFTTTGGPVP
jgi:hypothetical protein